MAEESIAFQFRNPVKQLGFAQIEHAMAMDPKLSDGAKITFILYLKYAHQNESCWPSIERIAQDRNKTTTTISRHNRELARMGYITRQRRMGRTSLTIIEDVEQIPRLQELASAELQSREDVENITSNITKMSRSTLQKRNAEEEPVKDNHLKESDISPQATLVGVDPPKPKPRVSAGSPKELAGPTGVTVYRSMTKLNPPSPWVPDFEGITDLDRWRSIIKAWLGCGYKKTNVAGMFECYTENRLPTTGGKRAESKRGYKPHTQVPDEDRALIRDQIAAQRRAARVEEIRPRASPAG